jgi:hypothetical protein
LVERGKRMRDEFAFRIKLVEKWGERMKSYDISFFSREM